MLGVGQRTVDEKAGIPESRCSYRDEKSFGGLETVLKVLQALLDQIAPRQMIERHSVILRQASAPNRL